MSAVVRLLVVAILAYVVVGLVYSTWSAASLELGRNPTSDLPPPWSSPMAFLAWFLLPAAFWPWNVIGNHGIREFLVACVYLATVGLFYLAARRRSAPLRINDWPQAGTPK
jgi:hypothetical protein